MRWFSRWYGANPLHLLTMIGCFALAGYAADRLLPHNTVAILVWLAGAVIGHDLLLMPLYTLADRSVTAVFRHRRPPHPPTVPWVNYLRVPTALSGMLLLIWFPLIFRLPARFTVLTSLSLDQYLWHWVAVTGALFLLSAVAFAVRLRTALGSRQEPAPGWRSAGPAADVAPDHPGRHRVPPYGPPPPGTGPRPMARDPRPGPHPGPRPHPGPGPRPGPAPHPGPWPRSAPRPEDERPPWPDARLP